MIVRDGRCRQRGRNGRLAEREQQVLDPVGRSASDEWDGGLTVQLLNLDEL